MHSFILNQYRDCSTKSYSVTRMEWEKCWVSST